MPTLAEHRLFTAAPSECLCHADRAPDVPRFAAEALPSETRRRRSRPRRKPRSEASSPVSPAKQIIDSLPPSPPAPPDIDPLTWLAVVGAAVAAINAAAAKLDKVKRRRFRNRKSADKLHRVCNVCAAGLEASGFSQRDAATVVDLDGCVRMTTMSIGHAREVAQKHADREGRDMVLLTVPVFVATRKEATRQELIRPAVRR